jgi:hypothetical protein
MQLVHESCVRSWVTHGTYGVRTPSAISSICPHCGDKGVISLRDQTDDLHRFAVASTGNCPGCSKPISFWAIRLERAPKNLVNNPASIYMYPEARSHYPNPDFLADIPAPLSRAFVSAVEALNSKNYAATAVCARRTLEGIFKYLVPEDKRNASLAKLIEHTKATVDLAAPLTSLSHAIRDGGNLGAHFDMEKEPSETLAKQMVELLEYLISYLYVLPKEIADLESALGKSI